jgi:hypothetical protein
MDLTSMILFFTTIVVMQLIEGIVWMYGQDPDVNFYASMSASGLLMLQPIALILMISPSSYTIPLLISYIVLGVLSKIVDQISDPRSLREYYHMDSGSHLIWKWLDPIPWRSLLIYFVFLIGPLLIAKQYSMITFIAVTLLVSIYSFGKGWGSMWCWIINGMVVIICGRAFLQKFLLKNKYTQ